MSSFKEKTQSFIALPIAKALIALIGILIIGVLFDGGGSFFKLNTHTEMLGFVSRYAILAFGMTLVIITGGIDLSVGSVLGLSAVAFSLLTIHFGVPGYLALPICVALGLACGLVSGTLIGRFKLQPFIVTLAMMVFARGAAKVLSGGQKVSTAVQIDGEYVFVEEPAIFETLSGKVFGDTIFTATIIAALVAFLCWILLSRLRFGRYLYAIGGNEESARLSGIPVIKQS
ncbi:ribose ABC transport system permease protein RbsC [Vibrio variabilis]|uniref:Ribose ABC transport system permease protein RbsC n=1 Tax=Vibrio variabilis TaxID=990271 RepID=A0ABQ0JHG1_9VIBR|nr:ribose ABC transport system permease protein RbsC [Vibrio variabilis]